MIIFTLFVKLMGIVGKRFFIVTLLAFMVLVAGNALAASEARVDLCHQADDGSYSNTTDRWSRHVDDLNDHLGDCTEEELNAEEVGKIDLCHQRDDGRYQDKNDYWLAHTPTVTEHTGDTQGACSADQLATPAEDKIELCHRNENGQYLTKNDRWSDHSIDVDDYQGECSEEHLSLDWDSSKGNRVKTNDADGKVTLCHKAGQSGKYVQITISTSAESTHIDGHEGDYLGVCSSDDSPPTEYVIGCKGDYLTSLLDAVVVREATRESSDDTGGEQEDLGLAGGHFDLDTSTQIYPLGSGFTNNHVHQWDDKYNLTTIDFFDIQGDGFDNVDTTIGDIQPFVLTVANSSLSPGGMLVINGDDIQVVDYEKLVKNSLTSGQLPVYTIGTPTDDQLAKGVRQLTSYSLEFNVNAILNGGLIPTKTSCVKGNDPGANNEYRNGALMVQALAVDSDTLAADYTLNDTYLYAETGSNLLWEATVFWHWSGVCYGDANWQTTRDECLLDGNCIGSSKHGHKKVKAVESALVTDIDYLDHKMYVCHKAGKSGKYVKLHISKSAACAHIGVPIASYKEYHLSSQDEAAEITDQTCVQDGHEGDFLTDEITLCPDHADAVADYVTITEEEANTEWVDAIELCLDNGAYIGEANTGRINWKQVIDQ